MSRPKYQLAQIVEPKQIIGSNINFSWPAICSHFPSTITPGESETTRAINAVTRSPPSINRFRFGNEHTSKMSSTIQPVSMEDNIQDAVTTTASVSSTVSPKVSLFAKKSGFVIPKNKLSGSLVPAFRAKKKPGGADVESEQSAKQILRKTKWGPDLTQDAFVKKGRASAYQTRLDQIAQQLKSGVLEVGDDLDHDSSAAQESSDHRVIVKSELEVERREVIGEILKLNPSYKAPPDYKLLFKEDKVVIPIKDYPGHNFIGLIFGHAGDTQKRLEKETGAKIRVFGTKANTKKESEITSSDGNEVNSDYDKLYVVVTAETYEKVDAAVSLIELLVTPVSANVNDSVSGDNLNTVSLNQDTPAAVITEPGLAPPLARFQPYPNQWVPSGQSQSQSPRFNAPAFPTPSNSGPMASSFSPRPMGQMHNMGYSGPPRNNSSVPRQPSFLTPSEPNPNPRPMGSAIPRPVPPYTFTERPLTTTNWSQIPARTVGVNMPQMMQPMARPQSSQPSLPPPPAGFQTVPRNPGPTSWFSSPTTPTSIPPPSIPSPPVNTALRPHQPSSNDFTFQTNRAQTPYHGPPPVIQGFHRPQNSHQMGHHQGPGPGQGQQPVFSGHGPRPPPNHVGPGSRQFGPGPPVTSFPPRSGSFGPVQQSQPGFRPQNLSGLMNQPFRGNVSYSVSRPGLNASGPQQVYDPFSPSVLPYKHGNPQNSRKQDSDPEYDDLMASVGVK